MRPLDMTLVAVADADYADLTNEAEGMPEFNSQAELDAYIAQAGERYARSRQALRVRARGQAARHHPRPAHQGIHVQLTPPGANTCRRLKPDCADPVSGVDSAGSRRTVSGRGFGRIAQNPYQAWIQPRRNAAKNRMGFSP